MVKHIVISYTFLTGEDIIEIEEEEVEINSEIDEIIIDNTGISDIRLGPIAVCNVKSDSNTQKKPLCNKENVGNVGDVIIDNNHSENCILENKVKLSI